MNWADKRAARLAGNSGKYSAAYWVDTKAVYWVGQLVGQLVGKKAATKAENLVACWVVTTAVTKGGCSVE